MGGTERKDAGPVRSGHSGVSGFEEDLVLTGVTCNSWNKGKNLSQEGLLQQHREEL